MPARLSPAEGFPLSSHHRDGFPTHLSLAANRDREFADRDPPGSTREARPEDHAGIPALRCRISTPKPEK